ncbi:MULTISPECIES: hypothetical protein [Streptomyces]|uniref:Uncharacterized protein n=1 Tax=Streptomyces albus (strain ATCC 21838 / DSM 41398 / FERM P-419 / JCM 4703 / NBRC 107858) TaxID=1081613 RepID=A0A0B5EM23_STRA4|nr:hypothetical protein [Streptomyces sp. SCSIO ZS0520]AJE82624.1 hypothetical protein SLNWT_2248 [Streptomyces albus]AOU76937.1 hypothetical protein SLNHY_2246 [Streptomyces albus]AYN32716.1 hypothetical protein DUI70_2212 [Streptomyces albus]
MDTGKLELAAQRYREAKAALDGAFADLQVEAIAALQKGSGEPGDHAEVARITGWSEEQVQQLMRRAAEEGVEAS